MKHIEQQLGRLRLTGMNKGLRSLTETRRVHEISFSDGLELLLQAEEEERSNKRFERLKSSARFRYQASLEELHYDAGRGLSKSIITQLAACDFITKGEAVLITGATGCGKSFLASALGHHACIHAKTVTYYNTQKLLLRLKMSRADGSILKFFDKLAKTSLLILDDFGLTRLEQQQQFDLMEIIEDRHGRASTIIASQLPVASWYEIINEATIADAILDRLVHTSHRIELKGESQRKKKKLK
jgi:DNA replication protein DnaC